MPEAVQRSILPSLSKLLILVNTSGPDAVINIPDLFSALLKLRDAVKSSWRWHVMFFDQLLVASDILPWQLVHDGLVPALFSVMSEASVFLMISYSKGCVPEQTAASRTLSSLSLT